MTREVLGYMLVPRKSMYPFFWLNSSPDKVWHKNSCILLIKVVLVAYLLTASLLLLPSLLASDFEADAAADELLALAARCLSRSQSILLIGYSFSLPPASELDRPLGVWLCDWGGWDAVAEKAKWTLTNDEILCFLFYFSPQNRSPLTSKFGSLRSTSYRNFKS